MSAQATIVADEFRPLKNNVFVTELDSGPRITHKGIIIPDDNMQNQGIRPRWGRVCSVGPEVTDLVAGDWVLVEHGRWTLGIDFDLNGTLTRMWRIEYPNAVLLAADSDPRTASKFI